MFAWIEARRAGLFAPPNWLRNIIAGIIVGIVALPLCMAFAIATGVKPEQGIYTAIVAGFIVSISGVSASAEVEEEETAVDEAEPEVVEKGKKTEEE